MLYLKQTFFGHVNFKTVDMDSLTKELESDYLKNKLFGWTERKKHKPKICWKLYTD